MKIISTILAILLSVSVYADWTVNVTGDKINVIGGNIQKAPRSVYFSRAVPEIYNYFTNTLHGTWIVNGDNTFEKTGIKAWTEVDGYVFVDQFQIYDPELDIVVFTGLWSEGGEEYLVNRGFYEEGEALWYTPFEFEFKPGMIVIIVKNSVITGVMSVRFILED